MSTILFSLPELFSSYKKWVSAHPLMASDFETTVKWLSFFLAGRVHNSTLISELAYSLSNLLVLFNDRIITKSKKLELPSSGDTLKLWLTVLEYCEVFFEISAKKLWGSSGKWLIIVILQVFKCISRFLLLFNHKVPMIECPPIPVLKRRTLLDGDQANPSEIQQTETNQVEVGSMSFVLKRSGRVVRKVEASPPINIRTWKPLNGTTEAISRDETLEKIMAGRMLVAELIYTLKPIAHLTSMLFFGKDTWKPWMVSLIFDMTSHQIYKNNGRSTFNLTKRQQLQLSRRSIGFIFYILRSPFYEKYSHERIQKVLATMGNTLPLVSIITGPLAKYIPYWQRIYYYMWSS